MNSSINRRDFLRRTAATGAGLWLGSHGLARAQSPNEKLDIGVIGVGGQGGGNLNAVSSENIVALCDIDEQTLSRAAERFPMATKYTDLRRLLDHKGLDAVVISTPDHHHALATIRALDQGLHVYCEKPLTHTVYEARQVGEMARRRSKLATQMGNQGHSSDQMRRSVELIQSGAIGPVREVHAWTDRTIWPKGIDRPTETPPVPSHIHWDTWLGPAPERPYHPAYLPFKWRGWWDFGTGALGDMGCHVLDLAFWALKLEQPVTVEAEGPPPHPETAPKWMIVRYEFPQRGELPPVKVTWYDGGKRPPSDLIDGRQYADNGLLFVGDRGRLYVADTSGGNRKLLPESEFADFKAPEPTIPNSIGHHAEWIQACKTGNPTGSNFVYAASLTEVVLLGNVAYRSGKKLEWNPRRQEATNTREARQYIRPERRNGWSLRG
jgi:predicted dehydrogenase